ncbi:MAG: GHKL domain-containing protein [Bacteroidales bacterium]|nr:GHKL domain-containing protein [Bacteroidota bacterium]MBL6949010.1 GHKL domain-containing protein [Bacteroidales bacterium]
MKKSQTSRKFYCISYLVLGLLALGILMLIPRIRKIQEKPDHILSSFELVLQDHEQHIRADIEFVFQKFFQDSTGRITESRLSDIREPADPELTLLIYQKDSLIYWSDNRVPFYLLPERFTTEIPSVIHLSNGWYEILTMQEGDYIFVGLCLIKQDYPFQNQYLQNIYTGSLSLPDEVEITLQQGPYSAFSRKGNFLCSLIIPDEIASQTNHGWWVIFLLLAYLFFIALLFHFSFHVQDIIRGDRLLVLLLVACIIILRGVQFFLSWPESLYLAKLFGPEYYSSSFLFPSLGDVLINSLLFLAISYIFYLRWPSQGAATQSTKWIRICDYFVRLLISFMVLVLVMVSIRSLVIHSSLAMNLENISHLSWESAPAFLSIGFLIIAWILFTMRLAGRDFLINLRQENKQQRSSFTWFFIAMVLSSVCATVVLNSSNAEREKEQREQVAMQLAHRQNPVTELKLNQNIGAMREDTNLRRIADYSNEQIDQHVVDDSLTNYILHRYFKDYWNNFDIQITICRESKTLRIQPQGFVVGCMDYFQDVITAFGRKTTSDEIFFLDYGYWSENYVARVAEENQELEIYIEVSSRNISKDLGYPELLVDRRSYDAPDIVDYSYAFYQENQLVYRAGEYDYGFDLGKFVDTTTWVLHPAQEGMDHFLYRIDEKVTLLVSKQQSTWLNIISPFSYLLIFLFILSFLGIGLWNLKEIRALTIRSLRNRLQLTMLGMILSSFIIIGILMMMYLTRLNSEKNEENLLERTLSILIEVEHKFDHLHDLQEIEREDLESVLIKFSNVFFSDINLYDPQGILLASSRSRIFQEELISDWINREALNQLKENKTSMFVQIENIGLLHYLSAYVPFYNTQNKLLGYLNLPYFSRQDDLKREISTFLVAFINIYVLFILLGALVTYLISNYITSPLKLLALRIGSIRFGKTDDKLVWRYEDEIGNLVGEYNRTLDELAVSAEKLAVSERESAWREMAQQVAHEIKNPLTPMKLSIQYLQKAWDDKAEDWDQRLNRFSEALIEQIDTLSAIASEFSYFAKMPEPENEIMDLDELVKTSMTIYKDVTSIRFESHTSPGPKHIYADRRQLLRVFSNLINNAIQAYEGQSGGLIILKTESEGDFHVLTISDNGKGIPAGEADKIFQPNFTTRSGGAGLGLAIVKGIVLSIGGEISFSSDPGVQTVFTVRFPAAKADDPKTDST